MNTMDVRFMLNTILALFLTIHMTKKQIKLENQSSSISHFWTRKFSGAARGAPQILSTPKIILTCTEWPNLNLETILGSIGNQMGPQLTAEC